MIQTMPNLKRKAIVGVAAKIARVCYGLVKKQSEYRPYYDEDIPGGEFRSLYCRWGQKDLVDNGRFFLPGCYFVLSISFRPL